METKPNFSIKLALSKGWQTYKTNFGFLIVTFILYLLIMGVINGLEAYLSEKESVFGLIIAIVGVFVSFLIQIGWVRIGLKLLNGELAEYEDLLKNGDRVLSYFLGNLLVGVIVAAGLVLLVIPGIYWALKYMYVPYLIADRNLKVGEAMRLSAVMTNGVKWKLVGYGFVQLGLIIAGVLALFVGLLAVLPTLWLTSLGIYQQLLNHVEKIDKTAQVVLDNNK